MAPGTLHLSRSELILGSAATPGHEPDSPLDLQLAEWAATDRRIGTRVEHDAHAARRPGTIARLRQRLRKPRSAGAISTREAFVASSDRPATSVILPTALASGTVDGERRVFAENLVASLHPVLQADDQVVVVLDAAAPSEVAPQFRQAVAALDQVEIVEAGGPFSFPDRVNRGVAASSTPVVVLLNDDTEVLSTDWLDRMASAANTQGVGAVGATLLYEDGSIQHAGVTTTDRLPTHAWYGWPQDAVVDSGLFLTDRPAWAVTGACLAVTRQHWEQVGGFSCEFPANYNDIDFCLKLADAGLQNVVLASVRLRHFETRSRPRELAAREVDAIQHRWWHNLAPDPLTEHTSALIDRRSENDG